MMKNIEIKSTYQIKIGEQITPLSRAEAIDLYYKLEKILDLNTPLAPIPTNVPYTPYVPGTPVSPIKHPWQPPIIWNECNPIIWNECGTGCYTSTFRPTKTQ